MASGKKNRKTRATNFQLDISIVEELGGTKDDLKLVENISDDDESIDLEDSDQESVTNDEILNYIKTLELDKHREQFIRDSEPGSGDEMEKINLETAVKSETKSISDPGSGDEMEKINLKTAVKSETKSISDPPSSSVTRKKKKKNKYKEETETGIPSQIQHDEVSSSTGVVQAKIHTGMVQATRDLKQHVQNYTTRKFTIVNASTTWFEEEDDVMEVPDDALVIQMEEFASKLLEDEVSLYNKNRQTSKRSEARWLQTVLKTGTLSDKIAALTLLIQESPIHSLSSLETLINMVKKKGKRESQMAADTLKELFLTGLLPKDKKLRTFSQHAFCSLIRIAGGNKDSIDRKLIAWLFEDKLKKMYLGYIKAVEVYAHDTLTAAKQKAVSTLYGLLVDKPEQEKMLLSILVNKVGDPDHKVASKCCFLLSKLVHEHPNMKFVIVEEVERLIYRPNVSSKAQYYGICFLNQLVLQDNNEKLAIRLIKLYFSFFTTFIEQGEIEGKMMSALLSGVNRAYPFTKADTGFINEQMNVLYRIIHMVNFNTGLQALMLIFQVMDSSDSISDRFYSALYRKMIDPALKTSAKQAVLLNIVYKSMMKDVSEKRVKAFIKRLLQICLYLPANVACGTLIILSEVFKQRESLLSICQHQSGDDSDDEEHFDDVQEDDVGASAEKDGDDVYPCDRINESVAGGEDQKPGTSSSSWLHRSNIAGEKRGPVVYDPYHRNPQYCGADNVCAWELWRLTQHFHPTVKLYADTILKGDTLSYDGDPLQDYTLMRFLDRFVYKNPKKIDRGADLFMKQKHKKYTPQGAKKYAVNTEKYLAQKDNKIPEDEKFFHQYFTQKAVRDKEKAGDDEVSDNEFDSFLDKYESHVDDGLQMDLDFAGEMKRGKVKDKGKKKKVEDNESDEEMSDGDDGDEMGDLSDEEADFEYDDDFASAFKDDEDDDDLGPESSDEGGKASDHDDQDLFELDPKPKRKRKAEMFDDFDIPGSSKKKGKKKSKESVNMFAAAEEFAHLMDDNANSKFDMLGINAMSNKDNADAKQLKWEAKQEQRLQSTNWKAKKFGNKKFGNKKSNKDWKSKKSNSKGFMDGKNKQKNKFKSKRN